MKQAIMKTMKFLSMAALALVGAVMTSCSSSDDLTENAQQPQPASGKNLVTLTTTVGFNGGTRALGSTGTKTFAEGETMAIVYKNMAGETVKAVSEALQEEDITTTGDEETDKKSATFTFTLTDPDRTVPVRYIYPAAMANDVATDAAIDDAGTVDYGKLDEQDGTLMTLSSTLDLATYDGAWAEGKLPGGTLQNRLAILACTIKKHAGDDFTSSITSMTVSDGTNTYTVNREAAAGPIYVAIRPTTDATINVTATNGALNYTKTLATKKTYEASNGYSVSWKMDLPVLNIGSCEDGEYTVTEDMVITGTSPFAGFQINTDGNLEITLDNVKPADIGGRIDLEFNSSMSIKLKGENRLTSINCGGAVTIDDAGNGTLIVINGGALLSGNFIINSGTVKAKNRWGGPAVEGNLTVNGGAVYLAGGDGAQAVDEEIGGKAEWYGWHDGLWMSLWYHSQYITTDDSSGDPTDPENSNWDW